VNRSKNPVAVPCPSSRRRPVAWPDLSLSALALAIDQGTRRHQGLTLVVCAGMQDAAQLEDEIGFFAADDYPLLSFPDWETLPYDVFSPHQDIVSRRLSTLYRLPQTPAGVLVVPITTLMQRLPPPSYLDGNALLLEVGERLDLEAFRQRLEVSGYRVVGQVFERGEMAIRGSIIDLFPMGSERPFRIDLLDDEVDSIRAFDPETQRSDHPIDRVELLPAREFPLDDAGIKRFRKAYRERFDPRSQSAPLYQDVSAGHAAPGIEYYLPLFFDTTATLFDYLPTETQVVVANGVADAAMDFAQQAQERYEARQYSLERPVLPPTDLFLTVADVEQRLGDRPRILVGEATPEAEPTVDALPDLRINYRSQEPFQALSDFLAGFAGRVLLIAESAGRREGIREQLEQHGIRPQAVDAWADFLSGESAFSLAVAPLTRGFVLSEAGLALMTENELYGERVQQRRRRRAQATRDGDAVLRDLTDLNIGAPVVHEDHGVGRYQGLQSLDVGEVKTEFLTLEYQGGDKLYVPVSDLHLISRYTGASPESAPLHRLGSEQWQRAKRKAAEQVRDVAAELLDIQARRAAESGTAFSVNSEDYGAFAAAFPFEETPDQATAIEAVIQDMQAPQPMDRVVCGDVGFGKTEVAMRAAFVAVEAGQQVAVLVPTTLLAQQHFENFRDRFAEWPFRIEALSRFRTQKQVTALQKDLVEGRLDIIIGTHKLLQDGIQFQNLGLVIVDEEQRFGVRHKEKLKSLRAQVDLLTLTATPIPRTMNMALSGLRDLSIIASPPPGRHAIKTFVGHWDTGVIQEACRRELKRGGQVYFLHNQVDTIDRIARQVHELVPEARLAVAHGQLRERELEQVMSDFYHQRYNILVCSTIIESGIDVPTANTIIINRADKLGLSQLHQLRGRVGRSHHRAYAYLLAPAREALKADAVKRLEAIEASEDLGVGFTLATHDLEIRGAGELLGEGQSGQIQEVGFTLYTELLDRAVKAMKSGQNPPLERPLRDGVEVDLNLPALLPADYVPDVHTRLTLYKRISAASDSEGLKALQSELIDRFGLLPEPAKNLFRIHELKLTTEPLGIRKLESGSQSGRIVFHGTPAVDPDRIIQLIQRDPQRWRLEGQDTLRFRFTDQVAETDRIAAVHRLVDELTRPAAP
jgi:transcription-repair coupling factor (superfamily II helicase)